MFARASIALFLLGIVADTTQAQAVRPQPYNAQLRTDPAVGNIQGIQRYGRPLKTDPDQGEGYSYHVYPVADPTVGLPYSPLSQLGIAPVSQAAPAFPFRAKSEQEARQQALEAINPNFKNLQTAVDKAKRDLDAEKAKPTPNPDTVRLLENVHEEAVRSREQMKAQLNPQLEQVLQALGTPTQRGASAVTSAPPTLYPSPFDATGGMRNYIGSAPGSSFPFKSLDPRLQAAGFTAPEEMVTQAVAVGYDAKLGYVLEELYHQPLIQVKVRVIEVARVDQFLASSVLDYISQKGNSTLFMGNNVNENRERLSGGTRFPSASNLITLGTANTLGAMTGSGMLVNLTTEHLNYIARFLATELSADVITAPEVVTLNGQNVEFVAGSRLPFELGQNVIQGTNNNIQQFFYKHVGTYISVTPKIVNWGLHSEGGGEAPVTAGEVHNWHQLIIWMLGKKQLWQPDTVARITPFVKETEDKKSWVPVSPVPIELKTLVLQELKRFSKADLAKDPGLHDVIVCTVREPGACPCSWNPQDCTVDLAVVVRLSEAGQVTLTANRGGADATTGSIATSEQNVRAIANIIQVKSGHGVVMAGLIGEREIEEVTKVPLLGDIPGLGFFFRSKGTNRQKTEVLIFIEAQVLDPCPDVARAQSAHDFTLGQPYVAGAFLDNPLEYGLYRAGFGTYLPPHSKSEKIFWERLGRKVRKACTTVDDAIE